MNMKTVNQFNYCDYNVEDIFIDHCYAKPWHFHAENKARPAKFIFFNKPLKYDNIDDQNVQ